MDKILQIEILSNSANLMSEVCNPLCHNTLRVSVRHKRHDLIHTTYRKQKDREKRFSPQISVFSLCFVLNLYKLRILKVLKKSEKMQKILNN